MSLSRTSHRVLFMSRSDLANWTARNKSKLQEIERELSSLSAQAAWVSEYCGFRGAYGCGQYDHADASAKADRKGKRVRRALGYSYP